MRQFFWSLYYDLKYLGEDILLLFKHPTRKATIIDIKCHFSKLSATLFFHPLYCLKRGIKNLVIFFPLIWGNDVYDYCYLLDLMDKQLSEMEVFFKSDKTHCMGAKRRGKRIAWIRKLMEMSRDEYYTMKHYDEYHKDKGERLFNTIPVACDEYGIPTMFQMVDDWNEEDKLKYREGMHKAWEMDQKCFNLIWKNMRFSKDFWD
jgi:hypothetical protein